LEETPAATTTASSPPTSKTTEMRRIEVLRTPMEGPYSTRGLYKEGKGGRGRGDRPTYPVAGELTVEEGRGAVAELSLGGSPTQGLSGLVQYWAGLKSLNQLRLKHWKPQI